MSKFIRKLTTTVLTLCLILSIIPTAFAASAVGTRFTVNVNGQDYYFAVTNADEASPEVEFSHTGTAADGGYPTSYTGEINIPETVEYDSVTYTVTSVGMQALRGTGVTKVTLPDTITSLGTAFYEATSLKEVVLNEGLTEIVGSTFYNCTSLEKVNIPTTVKRIGSQAFFKCTALTKLELPEGLEAIGGTGNYSGSVFASCSSLKEMTIPSTVTIIGATSFVNCAVSSLTIPAGVTDGAATALKGYSGEIIFADGSPYDLKDGILYKSDLSAQTKVAEGILGNIPENVTIAEGTTHIADELFYPGNSKDTYLKSVTLPDSLISIGKQAFYNCAGLTNIDIPASVSSLGEGAFRSTSLSAIAIPNGVTEIPKQLCSSVTTLKTIVIPESVTSIGLNAFSGLKSSAEGVTLVMLGETAPSFDAKAFGSSSGTGVKPSGLTVIIPKGTDASYLASDILGGYIVDNSTSTTAKDEALFELALANTPIVTKGEDALTTLDLSAALPTGAVLTAESSNPSIATATVDGSKITVTAVADGETTITANITVNGIAIVTDTCTIDVTSELLLNTETDSGYYAASRDAEEKSGVTAFKSFFEKYSKYDIAKYGFLFYVTDTNKVTVEGAEAVQLTENTGYFMGKVTDIPVDNFGTLVYAKPYAIINGNTYWGDAVSTSVNAVNKWLGEKEAE